MIDHGSVYVWKFIANAKFGRQSCALIVGESFGPYRLILRILLMEGPGDLGREF